MLALIGILLLSGAKDHNHVATEEIFDVAIGITVCRAELKWEKVLFLLSRCCFNDCETRDKCERQPIRFRKKIWDSVVNTCKQRCCP